METTQDPDRRVEEARESLLARVEEIARRVQQARDKLDIRAKIAAHPWPAVGIAFAAGALLALPKRSSKSKSKSKSIRAAETKGEVKGGLIGAAAATIGTIAFTLIKNVAMHHLSGIAKDWWDQRSQMEAEASRTRDVESFLEH